MGARTLFHFIPLYRRSCRWMGGKWRGCSVVPHDCSGSYPVVDENGIRFSFPTSTRQEAISRFAAKTVPTKKDTAKREQTSQAAITSFLVTE
jgi:hypothetical protein